LMVSAALDSLNLQPSRARRASALLLLPTVSRESACER